MTERGQTKLWKEHTEQTSARISRDLQETTDLYFPNGRPGA